MKAAAVMAVKSVEIIEVEKPTAGPYEVLVKTVATSLCTVEQRAYLGIKKLWLTVHWRTRKCWHR